MNCRLESPGLDAGETETVCIVFQYHMFGEGMGTLALYRTHSHSEEVTSPLFETSGNHGDRWIQANIQIKWINDQKVLWSEKFKTLTSANSMTDSKFMNMLQD